MIFLLIAITLATARPVPCTFTDSRGRFYDLSPLTQCNQSGYDLSSKGGDFKINICNQVSQCNSPTPICQDSSFSCGSVSSFRFEENGGSLYFVADNGDGPCPNGNRRASKISLVCNQNQETPLFSFISENPQCFYNLKLESKYACPVSSAPQKQTCMTKVFLVPHSHDDVGWLQTIEGYYNTQVKHILDTSVAALMANPKRTFIYVEQAFFYRWWTDPKTTNQQRDNLRFLLKNNQWEFVIGGWVMQDEACTTYGADIDQMTLGTKKVEGHFVTQPTEELNRFVNRDYRPYWRLACYSSVLINAGHQFLYKTFAYKPTKGWQIDPFGASSVTPLLESLAGFDAHIIDRITNKNQYFNLKTAQFGWISNSLPARGMFSEMLSGGGYCDWFGFFDFTNNPVDDKNVASFGNSFIKHVDDFLAMKVTPNVLAEWGCDFQFTNAAPMFESMDKVVKWLQDNSNTTFIDVKYTKLSDYFDSVFDYASKNSIQWPTDVGGDFFPYAPDAKNFWTGYFSSQSELKGFVRYGEAIARAVEQIYGLGSLFAPFDPQAGIEGLTKLRFANAEAQHHDGVSGTSVPEVVAMYQNHILDGASMDVGSSIVNKWVQAQSNVNPNITKGFESLRNIKDKETVALVFYNSLGWAKNEWVEIPVNRENFDVTDSNGKVVPAQIMAAISGNVTSKYVLLIPVFGVPPLGYLTLFVTATTSKGSAIFSPEEPLGLKDVTFANKFLSVTVADSTGRISKITNLVDNIERVVDQNLFAYTSQASAFYRQLIFTGAYVFRPAGPASPVSKEVPENSIIPGPYVSQINQYFPIGNKSWAKQTIRLYQGFGDKSVEGFVEVLFTIGPLPSHTEVVTRFSTDVQSAGILYTDDNGYEYNTRNFDYAYDIGGNFYPMIYSSYIEDHGSLLTLFSARTHAVSSQAPGQIEVMLHRNPDMGDGAGPSLTDTTTVYPVLRVGLESPTTAPSALHSQSYLLNFPLTVFSSQNMTAANGKQFQLEGQLIHSLLPKNIHLLSIYSIEFDPTLSNACTSCVIARFTHLYMPYEDPELSKPVQIEAAQLFVAQIKAMSETKLTANTVIQQMSHPYQFTISPKEIRTFVIQFAG